jgi:hypothetical protein
MPKGVYPRRRSAKPAKPAAKPAAKSPAPAPQLVPPNVTKWEYMDADPEIKRLDVERKQLFTKRDDLKQAVSAAFRKLQNYENAINVLGEKVCAYQDSTDSEEAVVRDITGHWAECWASGFSEVMDDLRALSIACSKDIVARTAEAEDLQKRADANWEVTKARRAVLGDQWDAAHFNLANP